METNTINRKSISLCFNQAVHIFSKYKPIQKVIMTIEILGNEGFQLWEPRHLTGLDLLIIVEWTKNQLLYNKSAQMI